ncbi:TetR family transcriptional regulator [Antricoccus suffuscus]|uniref:TetR family transcriptional regulator n=1 Tax=Antricoccus suffuscus TaxID=1629062 RepID=A0A2T1A613_9ACTN|nr:TetR/AcrR family transcriptional regulator [Antricoccus suffuscus]PRZ44053.1 TetR family transcriptional regulator [Antricoccus suffuscus]
MTTRDDQREQTRARILDAAVTTLLESGYSGVSTLAVQKAAKVSRGALLHHFATRADLSAALVEHLVERNETAVRSALSDLPTDLDPVARATRALYDALSRPAFQAELELWAAARTDPELQAALRTAERRAGLDLRRVVDVAFGAAYTSNPAYPLVADLTIALLRGLAISRVLRQTDAHARQLIDDWASLARQIFQHEIVAS